MGCERWAVLSCILRIIRRIETVIHVEIGIHSHTTHVINTVVPLCVYILRARQPYSEWIFFFFIVNESSTSMGTNKMKKMKKTQKHAAFTFAARWAIFLLFVVAAFFSLLNKYVSELCYFTHILFAWLSKNTRLI